MFWWIGTKTKKRINCGASYSCNNLRIKKNTPLNDQNEGRCSEIVVVFYQKVDGETCTSKLIF